MLRLLAAIRHRGILDRLALVGTLTVEDLAGALSVSRETIRRDPTALADPDKPSLAGAAIPVAASLSAPFDPSGLRLRG